jgi:hypothetical protein
LHVTVAARFAIHNYLPPHPVLTLAKPREFLMLYSSGVRA